jgi:lipopolysaccharide transport system ATP-binding protein
MSRREIARKFDAIVDFAEVDRYLETPVKRYSSGMYVRLAFAVAAHLEPEVLIADEVLSVGDAAFQRKCLARMESYAHDGRTVLFVSHSMTSVVSLCRTAIWLENGCVRDMGLARELAPAYTADLLESAESVDGTSGACIRNVRLLDADGCERYTFDVLEPFSVELTFHHSSLPTPPRVVLRIRSAVDSTEALVTADWDATDPITHRDAGIYRAECRIPGNLLNRGSYMVSVALDEPGGTVHSLLRDIKPLVIVREQGLGERIEAVPQGVLSPYREWNITPVRDTPVDG